VNLKQLLVYEKVNLIFLDTNTYRSSGDQEYTMQVNKVAFDIFLI